MLQKSDFDPFLREYWTTDRVEQLTYQNRPLMAKMPKKTDVGGEYWVVPVDVDDGADGGPTFATAQATAQNTTSGVDGLRKQFQVQYVEDYELAQISNKIIRLSRDTPRLALQKAVELTKKKQNVLAARIARNMYKSGYNDLGVIGSFTGSTFTLANNIDARNFRIGQPLRFASTMTGALEAQSPTIRVTKIDFDQGIITTDAATSLATQVSTIANGDIVFLDGGRGSGSNPTILAFQGLASWIPTSAPSGGENFNGVDRSVWPDRLAGLRYNKGSAVSGPIQEIMIDALVDAAIREAYVDTSFLDPALYGQALKAFEGTVERVQNDPGVSSDGKPTKVGFNGFSIQVGFGSNGTKVFPDANCPSKTQYNVMLETWAIGTAGELIQNDLQAGNSRDVENASAVEYRYVFCGAMSCFAPGKNQVVKYA